MKKMKNLAFLMVIGVISILTINDVKAAGWISNLDLPYGTIHTGAVREYGTGTHRIMISVDGFNTSNGSIRYSGETTMRIALGDVATGRIFKYNTSVYMYGTCLLLDMGSYSSGYRYYTFMSSIYNSSTDGRDNYDGVIANDVYMYPSP